MARRRRPPSSSSAFLLLLIRMIIVVIISSSNNDDDNNRPHRSSRNAAELFFGLMQALERSGCFKPTPFGTAGSVRSGLLFCWVWERGFQTPFETAPSAGISWMTRWTVAREML